MEIKTASDMAKWLREMAEFSEDDDVLEISNYIEVGPCTVNTFVLKEIKTDKSYLVNVKEVK